MLVVDDDPSALKLAERLLGELGLRSLCTPDPHRGLELADSERPAAIVLDLLMPEMDGFEFLNRLRRTPAGRRTPAIVWTVKDPTAEERQRLHLGAQSIVVKGEGSTHALLQELRTLVPLGGR